MLWDKATYLRDTHITDTAVGRYLIRRPYRGAREYRLYLNGQPTTYRGSVEHLKWTVEQILAGSPLR